jgi:hypothetical protein
VPAVSVSQAAGSNLVFINAEGGHNLIQIEDAGLPNPVMASIGGTGMSAPVVAGSANGATPLKIVIFTNGGPDTIDFFSPRRAAGQVGGRLNLVVNLGSPGDAVNRMMSTGVSLRSGRRVHVVVNGRTGAGETQLHIRPVLLGQGSFALIPGTPSGNNPFLNNANLFGPSTIGVSSINPVFQDKALAEALLGGLGFSDATFGNSFGTTNALGVPSSGLSPFSITVAGTALTGTNLLTSPGFGSTVTGFPFTMVTPGIPF